MVNSKYIIILRVLCLVVLITSCNEHTPKPLGYNRIDESPPKYRPYQFFQFSFDCSDQVRVDTLRSEKKNEVWFNVVYPQYNAVIYCTYLPISKQNLPQVLNDSYKLAFSHTVKADAIEQKNYANPSKRVFGTIYSIQGSVATPIQFFLTDSVSQFFRGSFYYTAKVNPDSVAPITQFVMQDIEKLMGTFSWNNIRPDSHAKKRKP